MGRRRTGPSVACPVPEHAGSHVVRWGKRMTQQGLRQKFVCRPVGHAEHGFSMLVSGGEVTEPVWAPPPACPEHPAGRVVRDGLYGASSERPRQRYRCYPDGEGDFHRFTPPLPREHVHSGEEPCAQCEEFRGMHHGEPSISRKQSWSSRLVAETLRDLSRGTTYADASVRVRRVTNRTRTRTMPGPPKYAYTGSRSAKNAWHIAADWCETFSPVLWDRVEEQLRERAAAAQAEAAGRALAGEANPTPSMVVIDDIPIHARTVDADGSRVARRDYFVLALAEVVWGAPAARLDRTLSLRLVRAYPSNDHHAWKLLFDELGYTPDFILADAGKGIVKAVREFYKGSAVFIPSVYHAREAVEKGLLETAGARNPSAPKGVKELRPEIAEHMAGLRKKRLATLTVEEWSRWWDDLEGILSHLGVPIDKTRRRRRNYERPIAEVLPQLAAFPQLPISTGGLEATMRKRIDPILTNRAHAFANIERTNRLFDLVVCNENHLFDDMAKVIRLLRADSAEHDGWSTPLREIADPQPPKRPGRPTPKRYSSLRDQQLIRDIARSKGLA